MRGEVLVVVELLQAQYVGRDGCDLGKKLLAPVSPKQVFKFALLVMCYRSITIKCEVV